MRNLFNLINKLKWESLQSVERYKNNTIEMLLKGTLKLKPTFSKGGKLSFLHSTFEAI